VEGAKTNPEVLKMIEPLHQLGGGGADAAAQLRILTYSPAEASSSAGPCPTDQEGVMTRDVGGMIAVEDLQMQAGGRHDNDHANFRDIKIMVTSDEVRDDRTFDAVCAA
jgi:hypothetical protein